ncbi:MAG TPA: PTS cellobiose transporter subunit IIC [Clostridiaceae bacterium]|nr:PTS cellobiose transporter subunit IIC [Clostridiaceae bacterium]
MNKFTEMLEEKLMPIASRVASNKYLIAIRDGFALALPLLIIGAIHLLLANLPITGYPAFMAGIFGPNWATFFVIPFNATMAIMAIFVVLGIAYSLAGQFELDQISTAVIALVSFLIITPLNMMVTPAAGDPIAVGDVIPFTWIGSRGLFVGILTAIFATLIVRFVVRKNWVISMPDGVPPTVAKGFSALIPAVIVFTLFNLLRLLMTFTSFGTVHDMIFNVLQTPLTALGATLPATLVANFFIGLFWVFGIHGANIVGAVMGPIWLSLSADNLNAFQAGQPLPNIITQQFQELYLQLGGSGSTLSLALIMLFLTKSQLLKKLGKLAILPGLFNINEPITFGVPIVLNPLMMIPFILTPMILAVFVYYWTALGFVPRPSGVIIPWTTPPIIGGLLMAGIPGAITQLIELVISFFIYYPFIMAVDKQYLNQELEAQHHEETASV